VKIKIPFDVRIPGPEHEILSFPSDKNSREHEMEMTDALERLARAERHHELLGKAISNLRSILKEAL